MSTTFPPLRIHATDPLPHEGGCQGCRDQRQCNHCGARITMIARCTNGRCLRCHATHCAPGGGAIGPGHGYWKSAAHRTAALRATKPPGDPR
jgi:hypothetical protein